MLQVTCNALRQQVINNEGKLEKQLTPGKTLKIK